MNERPRTGAWSRWHGRGGRHRVRASGLLIGATLLWMFVARFLVSAQAVGVIESSGPVESVAVRWSRPGQGPSSGVWVMGPDESRGAIVSTRFRTEVPTERLESITLEWSAIPPSSVMIVESAIEWSVFGHVFDRRDTGRWESAAEDSGSLKFASRVRIGTLVHGVGFGACLAVSVVAWGVGLGLADRRAHRWLPEALVAFLVVLVVVFFGLMASAMMTSDGVTYVAGADGIATEGVFSKLVVYKAPGLSLLLAGVMRFTDDWLEGFKWLQLVVGMLAAMGVYIIIRGRAGRVWALVGAGAVGMHPILLTYSAYLLRESLSASLLVGLMLAMAGLAAPRRRLWACAGVGVICGLGALLRENFQMLLVLIPLGVVAIGPVALGWRTRVIRGVAVLVAGLATILPWVTYNAVSRDVLGVTSPKVQINRLLSAWNAGVVDGDNATALDAAGWSGLQESLRRVQVTDYEYYYMMIGREQNARVGRGESERIPFAEIEAMCKRVVDEDRARHGQERALAMLNSFLGQTGLWNLHLVRSAQENDWWSRPMRALYFDRFSTLLFDKAAAAVDEPTPEDKARLMEILEGVEHPTNHQWTDWWPHIFNDWFRGAQALRPVVAVLYFAGLVRLWRVGRGRDVAWARALGVVGLACMVMVLATALTVAPASDRYGVPYIPVMIVVGLVGIWGVTPGSRRRCSNLGVAPCEENGPICEGRTVEIPGNAAVEQTAST